MADNTIQFPESDYNSILRQAVAVIDKTRNIVAASVTSAIGSAHWELGKLLHDKKLEYKHGSGVVNRLSMDLKKRFPQMGMSPRNLWDMKKFYERFCDSDPKVRQVVAVLPWGHTLKLMQKFGNDDEAILYYAQEVIAKGWSRDLLTNAISMQMHLQKNEPTDNNFSLTLPPAQAQLADEVEAFGKELPSRTEISLLDSEHNKDEN
jgi:hypothetical protein